MTCKSFALPLWTTYDTVSPPHPAHLLKPEIQPLLIRFLPILLAPVLLLLPPLLLSSARALSHRPWGAHSRVWSWSWDQATARRCPTQLLWTSSIQSSCVTWPTSRSCPPAPCRQCKALTCTLTWILRALVAEDTILDKKELDKNHRDTQQLCSVWCYCPLHL